MWNSYFPKAEAREPANGVFYLLSRFLQNGSFMSGKYPLGCSIMCWLSWISGPGCCSCPRFHLGLGASDCSPGLAFCFTGPWTSGHCLDLLRAAPPPPAQKRDAQHMFLQHRGAHADYGDRKLFEDGLGRPENNLGKVWSTFREKIHNLDGGNSALVIGF